MLYCEDCGQAIVGSIGLPDNGYGGPKKCRHGCEERDRVMADATFSDGVDFTPLRCSLLQLNALFIGLSLELNTNNGVSVLKPRQGTLLQLAKAYGFKAKRKKTLYLDLLECFEDNQLVQPGGGWKGAPDGVFPNG